MVEVVAAEGSEVAGSSLGSTTSISFSLSGSTHSPPDLAADEFARVLRFLEKPGGWVGGRWREEG